MQEQSPKSYSEDEVYAMLNYLRENTQNFSLDVFRLMTDILNEQQPPAPLFHDETALTQENLHRLSQPELPEFPMMPPKLPEVFHRSIEFKESESINAIQAKYISDLYKKVMQICRNSELEGESRGGIRRLDRAIKVHQKSMTHKAKLKALKLKIEASRQNNNPEQTATLENALGNAEIATDNFELSDEFFSLSSSIKFIRETLLVAKKQEGIFSTPAWAKYLIKELSTLLSHANYARENCDLEMAKVNKKNIAINRQLTSEIDRSKEVVNEYAASVCDYTESMHGYAKSFHAAASQSGSIVRSLSVAPQSLFGGNNKRRPSNKNSAHRKFVVQHFGENFTNFLDVCLTALGKENSVSSIPQVTQSSERQLIANTMKSLLLSNGEFTLTHAKQQIEEAKIDTPSSELASLRHWLNNRSFPATTENFGFPRATSTSQAKKLRDKANVLINLLSNKRYFTSEFYNDKNLLRKAKELKKKYPKTSSTRRSSMPMITPS